MSPSPPGGRRLFARTAALVLVALAATAEVVASDARTAGVEPVRSQERRGGPAFQEVYERSFELILPDSLRDEYASMAPADRVLYRRRFWIRNDPAPATDDNELLNEFAGRVQYALSNFCTSGRLTWDDRGDIAVRFGVPASRMSTVGDFGLKGEIVYPTESWYYPRTDMSVEFVMDLDDGTFRLGSNPPSSGGILLTSDLAIAPVTDPVDPGVDVPDVAREVAAIEGEHAAYLGEQTAARGHDAVESVPMSYGYTPPVPPITVFYEIVTAKGAEGLTDVAVNYQVPLDGLALRESADQTEGGIVKRLRILDRDHSVVASEVRRLGIACEVAREPGDPYPVGPLITDEWRFDAPPGEYTIEIAVEDTASGRAGFGRSRTFVRGYTGDRLAMSGIQLATAVGPGSRFVRMDGSVTPNPCHAYWRYETLVIYFELYNLTEDRPGQSRFTVTTEISTREKKRGWLASLFSRERPHAVSSRVIATGGVPDAAYWFSLELRNLPEGNYDLEVAVKDVRSKQEAAERTAFTVVEKP